MEERRLAVWREVSVARGSPEVQASVVNVYPGKRGEATGLLWPANWQIENRPEKREQEFDVHQTNHHMVDCLVAAVSHEVRRRSELPARPFAQGCLTVESGPTSGSV